MTYNPQKNVDDYINCSPLGKPISNIILQVFNTVDPFCCYNSCNSDEYVSYAKKFCNLADDCRGIEWQNDYNLIKELVRRSFHPTQLVTEEIKKSSINDIADAIYTQGLKRMLSVKNDAVNKYPLNVQHLKIGQLVWWHDIKNNKLAPSVVTEVDDCGCPIIEGKPRTTSIFYWIEPLDAQKEDLEERKRAIAAGEGWCPKYRPGHGCIFGYDIFLTKQEGEEFLDDNSVILRINLDHNHHYYHLVEGSHLLKSLEIDRSKRYQFIIDKCKPVHAPLSGNADYILVYPTYCNYRNINETWQEFEDQFRDEEEKCKNANNSQIQN